MKMKIGLSLSFCIGDILRGEVKVEEVSKLITATACSTNEEFEKVVKSYCENYSQWRKNPERARELAYYFWNNKMIEQPRLIDEDSHPGLNDGRWIED